MEKIIAKNINKTGYYIRRYICNMQSIIDLENVSGTNVFIFVHLYKNKDKEIFQKDIEKEFGMTRSTASNILALMEKKGLIKRIPSLVDKRLKQVVLTPLGDEYSKKVKDELDDFNSKINNCFNDEEKKQLFNYLERINEVVKKKEENNNDQNNIKKC